MPTSFRALTNNNIDTCVTIAFGVAHRSGETDYHHVLLTGARDDAGRVA